jgi:hypothetical protein
MSGDSIPPSIRSLAGLGSKMQASLNIANARSASHSRAALAKAHILDVFSSSLRSVSKMCAASSCLGSNAGFRPCFVHCHHVSSVSSMSGTQPNRTEIGKPP